MEILKESKFSLLSTLVEKLLFINVIILFPILGVFLFCSMNMIKYFYVLPGVKHNTYRKKLSSGKSDELLRLLIFCHCLNIRGSFGLHM